MAGFRASCCALVALLAVAGLLLAPAAGQAAPGSGGGHAAKAAPLPNVITIVTDDQTLEQYRRDVMPKTASVLGDHGTTFSQAIVSTPQCCPSRAGYLTGQYAHNNGLISNNPGYEALKRPRDVLPAWLSAAGYRTVHIGKYMKGYSENHGLGAAPGWDRWLTMVKYDYLDPAFTVDGHLQRPGYLTTFVNEKAVQMIDRYAPRRKPFYLQVDQYAPHFGSGLEEDPCKGGAIPLPADREAFAGAKAPVTPATTEIDLSDKPEFVSRQTVIGPIARERNDLRYACALGSLASADRGVGQIAAALRRSGELGNTMIVFTSDNGFSYNEHRLQLTKGLPYEEDVRVPLVIRPPARFPKKFREGATLDAPVANIDLAPTILGAAKADPCRKRHVCRRLDGRSLLPLLRGAEPGWAEQRALMTSFSINAKAFPRSCTWDGFRTPALSLTEHLELPEPGGKLCQPAAEYEVYDLAQDPFQLGSLDPAAADVERLQLLQRCSGIKGRDKRLKSRPFCE